MAKHVSNIIDVTIRDANGKDCGSFEAIDADPIFRISVRPENDPLELPNLRGRTLILRPESDSTEERVIVSDALESSSFGFGVRLLAPRQISRPDPHADYVVSKDVPLRPGTLIIGGRESGFYDAEGIILKAHHIGGDPKKFEDWCYFVVGPSSFHKDAPQWILLDHIGMAVSGPNVMATLKLSPSRTIDDLLAEGEKELFEYFVSHPTALETLDPKRFGGW